ncbi:MAG: retron system putative HNH endonuclease [Fimbriiglobus sp.]
MRKQSRPELPENLQMLMERWQAQYTAARAANHAYQFIWYANGLTAREHLLPILRDLNQSHCSFCDAFPVEGISNAPIEHFRPKSEYPGEAYDWDNLYFICDCCNTNKREKWFPEVIRPDDPEYEFLRFFTFTVTGEIEPNQFASEQDQTCARVTIDLYGLNYNPRPSNRLRTKIQFEMMAHAEIDDMPYRDFLEYLQER